MSGFFEAFEEKLVRRKILLSLQLNSTMLIFFLKGCLIGHR